MKSKKKLITISENDYSKSLMWRKEQEDMHSRNNHLPHFFLFPFVFTVPKVNSYKFACFRLEMSSESEQHYFSSKDLFQMPQLEKQKTQNDWCWLKSYFNLFYYFLLSVQKV